MTTATTRRTGFQINGTMHTILVMEINEVNHHIGSEIIAHCSNAPKLFRNQPLIISIDQVNFHINGDYLKSILAACQQMQINVIGVTGCHSLVAQEAVKAAALNEITLKKNHAAENEKLSKKPEQINTSETIRHGHVRSGQSIEAPGTLVIIGNISRGAEVIAGGSIHVYGSLNGRAIAGSFGDTQATIIAQAFDPELVCIAGIYITSEQSSISSGELTLAKLVNNTIKVTRI